MSEELCDGVKMLIERMQTNPEDFDYTGRLYEHHHMINELFETPQGHQRLWFLNDTEKQALKNAYKEMHKTKFTAGVVQSILNPPDYDINMDRPYRNSSSLIATQNMVKEAEELLNEQFDKEYALRNFEEYAKNHNP